MIIKSLFNNTKFGKIELDFINSTSLSLRFTALSSFILLLGIGSIVMVWQLRSQVQSNIKQTNAMLTQASPELKQSKAPIAEASPPISAEQVNHIKVISDLLVTPWEALFDSLEQANNKDIALIQVQPDSKKKQLNLIGEGRNLAAVLVYIDQLESQQALKQVYLLKHVVSDTQKEKPVRFTVHATWEHAAL